MKLASCIGCGCDDFHGCPDGCWWLRLDRAEGKGVCSKCEDHLDAWDRGDHTSHAVPASEDDMLQDGTLRIERLEIANPGTTPCRHDWPFEDVQESDQCRWCGMSFIRHVFTEMP